MTVYAYRCGEHGTFDERHPIGTAPASTACPTCDGPAGRSFTAPALSVARPGAAALDAQARSAERPGVVRRVPTERPAPSGRTTPMADPRRAGLPRP